MIRIRDLEALGTKISTQDVHAVSTVQALPALTLLKVFLDIPAHCYQLSFEANPSWSSFYAQAPEILDYWKRVANKYRCRKYMKLGYKAVEAKWDERFSKWKVILEDIRSGRKFEEESDVLISAIGSLNEWNWPPIPGLQDFGGKLLHSAAWDQGYIYKVC